MDGPPGGMPAQEEGLVLHARLLAGDPTAPADLAAAYLDPLVARLATRNRRVTDPDLCTVAAGEAILALIAHPERYDPVRGSLASYLALAAQRDLQNLLRSERRHSARRADLEAVELSPVAGKYLWDVSGDPARLVELVGEETGPASAPPPGTTPEEARVLALLRAGERKTAAYAVALGIADRPAAEQEREVKRVKDRLKKRLARAASPRATGGTDV